MSSNATLLSFLLAILTIGQVSAASQTFSNAGSIAIGTSGTAPIVSAPYPSTITVPALPGTIAKVTVKLTAFSHTYPGDVDMMLVAPDGKRAVILSDAGGSFDANGINVTLDDDAAASLPAGALATGTFKPTDINSGTADSYPAPAPVADGNVALSTFNGIAAAGNWNLYVVDDANGDSGNIINWSLTITTGTTANPGDLVISEFRLRGPLKGRPNGATDEFIEIRNTTESEQVVLSNDGSAGYAVVASDGVTRFVIPNGTIIPPGGHYLGGNADGYSLSNYPGGPGATATPDVTYTTEIPDNKGIAIFRTSNPANFTLANRLDAAGSTLEANTLYKEGTGYPWVTSALNLECSFHRNLRDGEAQDTDNNSQDFLYVDTDGNSAGAGQRLGAPGPENLSSPVRLKTGPSLTRRLVDPDSPFNSSPNRIRDFTSNVSNNSTFGTYCVNRMFANTTGANITRLRFRVVDLSAFPSPSGIADLRVRTSSNLVVNIAGGGTTTINGTVLEQDPVQLSGGGFNSTLSAPVVSSVTPLPPGGSVNLRFLFGIQQTGEVRLALIPETVPACSSDVWILSGSTENVGIPFEMEKIAPAAITRVSRIVPDVEIEHFCAPGVVYQLQRSTNLGTWTDLGQLINGTGLPVSYTQSMGGNLDKQFYRLKEIK